MGGGLAIFRSVFTTIKNFEQGQANLASVLGVNVDKMKELTKQAKAMSKNIEKIDVNEVKEEFGNLLEDLQKEVEDLDRAKVEKIAKRQIEEIKVKADKLVDYAVEKGTPVLEKTASEVREKAIDVTKDVLKKLKETK
jgi:predicted adenine nucleotide alpha hydrolase (AANH) superfamily ATPase